MKPPKYTKWLFIFNFVLLLLGWPPASIPVFIIANYIIQKMLPFSRAKPKWPPFTRKTICYFLAFCLFCTYPYQIKNYNDDEKMAARLIPWHYSICNVFYLYRVLTSLYYFFILSFQNNVVPFFSQNKMATFYKITEDLFILSMSFIVLANASLQTTNKKMAYINGGHMLSNLSRPCSVYVHHGMIISLQFRPFVV